MAIEERFQEYFAALDRAGHKDRCWLCCRTPAEVKAFFGFDDINFESAEFSRRFFVQAPDKRWAYDVIHPRTMEFLLAQPMSLLQFDAAAVIAWRGNTLGPAEFEQLIETARGVLDRLPPYLVQQQQTTNPAV